MILTRAPTVVLGLALLAAPALAAERIQPGYWESTNRVISPFPSEKVETRCITPADVNKFMMGPSNRRYACTYPTRSFTGGKILLKGTCVDKNGKQVAVEGRGAYTATTFNLTADIAMEFAGLPIAGRAQTEARRIADACPTPAPEAAPPPPAAPDEAQPAG